LKLGKYDCGEKGSTFGIFWEAGVGGRIFRNVYVCKCETSGGRIAIKV
jgi:hypothetical protein